MKNKKLIRLTEGDLHRIVKESVNKVLKEAQLNELDPRTYRSASEKARMRGEFDRARKFKNTAVDSWNREFGNEREDQTSRLIDPRNYSAESLGNGETYVSNRKIRPGYGNIYHPSHSEYGDDYRFSYTPNSNEPAVRNAPPLTKGEKVAKQMIQGNGKYIKGKGWED